MSDKTKIEWTQATWNPITGCSVVSPGCQHCYAMEARRREAQEPSQPPRTHGGHQEGSGVERGGPVQPGMAEPAAPGGTDPERYSSAPMLTCFMSRFHIGGSTGCLT